MVTAALWQANPIGEALVSPSGSSSPPTERGGIAAVAGVRQRSSSPFAQAAAAPPPAPEGVGLELLARAIWAAFVGPSGPGGPPSPVLQCPTSCHG